MSSTAALRLSMLAALGLAPVGCGAATEATDGTQSQASSACTSPTTDPVTGLVSCSEGYSHRPAALACVAPVGNPVPSGDAAPQPAALPRANGEDCTGNPATCDAFAHGFCKSIAVQPGGGVVGRCESGCVTDDDCAASSFCICGSSPSPTGGVCAGATCRTDAECTDGALCASYAGPCGDVGFACLSQTDECATNADCGMGYCSLHTDVGPNGELSYRRTCGNFCSIGRPFLVGATLRHAVIACRTDWQDEQHGPPRLDQLTAAERAKQAAHWAKQGLMEHASIAAFARFSLQLLSLGAPPELIDDCTRALADETAHAKLCFQIASACAGCPIGPGPLDIRGSLEVTTLTDIVDLVIVEGCFGETSAALEALEAAAVATDPVIRGAYTRIARDEQRHAELAFRFVRWALEREPLAVRERILAARRSVPNTHSSVRDVVLPCFDALLAIERVPSTQELFT